MSKKNPCDLEAINIWLSVNLIEYVLADLDTRIKKDKPVKLSVFFTGLSAFQEQPLKPVFKRRKRSWKKL